MRVGPCWRPRGVPGTRSARDRAAATAERPSRGGGTSGGRVQIAECKSVNLYALGCLQHLSHACACFRLLLSPTPPRVSQVLHAKTMNIGQSGTNSSHAILISTGSGFAEHPDDTYVAYSPPDVDLGTGAGDSGALPHSSGSIGSDDSHLRDFPVGSLRHEGSLQRDTSVPTSALNPNYEYALPTSLALVAPEPDAPSDEILKPSLFDRDAGGYRPRQPEPPGVVAAAASNAGARRDRYAATIANVPSEAARAAIEGRAAADRPLIDLSTENASAHDASGSQAGGSGAGSIGQTPSLASGASAVGNNTAPVLGAHREPSLQARSGGVTGSTVIRAPYDTEESQRTHVYMPHTQSTYGRQTEGRTTRDRTVDGTIDEDAVYEEPSASAAAALQARGRAEIGGGAGKPPPMYTTLAPAVDVGLETTDVTVGETGIRSTLKQLDVFTKKDLFLGKFELLGRQQRRRGGACLTFASVSTDTAPLCRSHVRLCETLR